MTQVFLAAAPIAEVTAWLQQFPHRFSLKQDIDQIGEWRFDQALDDPCRHWTYLVHGDHRRTA